MSSTAWQAAKFRIGEQVISKSLQQQVKVSQILSPTPAVGQIPTYQAPFYYGVGLLDGSTFTVAEDDLVHIGGSTTTG